MNKHYKKALEKGVAIAYGANGRQFTQAISAMTQDMTEEINKVKHRKRQTITVKGVFKGAALE